MEAIVRPAVGERSADRRIDGVVVGALMGFSEQGEPLVVFAGNPVEQAVPARSTAPLSQGDVGAPVALLFEGGDPRRPLIVGKIVDPGAEVATNAHARLDGERVEIEGKREITLRCGKASVTLTAAGKIILRGAYILSRSTGVNKIKGGSVQLN